MQQTNVNQSRSAETPDFAEARQSLKKWTRAIASGEVAEILPLYAPNAILVPTLSNEIVVDEDGRRQYFEFLLSNGKAKCAVDSEKIRADDQRSTVAIGGIYIFFFERDTGLEEVPARYLFTFEKLDNRWLITGHHSSRCV